jgi:hypothetical protein
VGESRASKGGGRKIHGGSDVEEGVEVAYIQTVEQKYGLGGTSMDVNCGRS